MVNDEKELIVIALLAEEEERVRENITCGYTIYLKKD